MNACSLFPECVVTTISLISGLSDVVVSKACTGCWTKTPLCSMVVIALSGPYFFVIEAPRSNYELECEGMGIGALLLGEETGVYLYQKCPLGSVLCGVSWNPLCGFTKYTCWLFSRLYINCGKLGNLPWSPSGVHQGGSARTDPLKPLVIYFTYLVHVWNLVHFFTVFILKLKSKYLFSSVFFQNIILKNIFFQ